MFDSTKYSHMNAAVLYAAGGPDNFVLENRPVPVAKPGGVLVKVRAFGLNRSEIMTRKGYSPDVTFPRILGIECVGEIAKDPSGEYQEGQKVAAFMGHMGRHYDGSYAEYTVLPKEILIPFKSELSWDILGAVPEMFQTAYGSLHIALKIKAGETILIRGGTSSVGLLAAQIAKAAGLHIISTTRDEAKRKLLFDNGADEVLIDNGQLFEQITENALQKIDKVLELIGTITLKDSLKCVVAGGAVCMTGMLSEKWSINDFDPMGYIPAAVNLTVYDSGQIRVSDELFRQFLADIENGIVTPAIKRTFQLSEIGEAHRYMENNSGGGKIVVVT
jgi:NADPH2:quinone reductase